MMPSRRWVLKAAGVQLALPLLDAHLADAQPTGRHRFIGCYVPNGAYMPAGANGSFTWADALQPLEAAGHRPNTMVLRGLHNGFGAIDPHWQNCAGFLSCEQIVLNQPGVVRCGKTVDQYVAEKHLAPLRSLEIGGLYYHVHQLNDHPGYSDDYLNRISWQTADRFRSPIPQPAQLFAKLFGASEGSAAQLAFARARKKSVLDQVGKDARRLSGRLPASYRPVLDSYLETVREVEQGLSPPMAACTPSFASPTDDFSGHNTNYVRRFDLMHQMVALAMQCGLINAATIMYGPGVSDHLSFPQALGQGNGHHACAHHGGTQAAIDRLKAINKLQVGLLADLLTKLKAAQLLGETLVLYGSDMSDGNVHLAENLPMLLCGAGTDLKFGQDVGSASVRRPLANVHVEILNLLGVQVTRFGSGESVSTAAGFGIRS
jgi:hypothetical protein